MKNAFRELSKRDLRFTYSKGVIEAADLWKILMTDLDKLGLYVKDRLVSNDETLLSAGKLSKVLPTDDEVRFAVIMEVITEREKDIVDREKLVEERKEYNELLEIAHQNKISKLRGKKPSAITKRLAELESRLGK